MSFNLANILVFLVVGFAFVLVCLVLGKLVRPAVPTAEKLTTYECGEPPVGQAWINFNMRFYMIALFFIIFDVEVTFMFPVAAVFKSWLARGDGWLALAEIMVFVGILLLGLVYVWVSGDLQWIKTLGAETKRTSAHINSPPRRAL